MNEYKAKALTVHIGKVGPGGPHCPCCTKGPWREIKPLVRRSVRRVWKQELRVESLREVV